MIPDIITFFTTNTLTFLSEAHQFGIWVYVLIFLVIFIGSSFVITVLPGNSLLFISGAMAMNHELSLGWVLIIAIAAAYIGYDLNYWSGKILGITVCQKRCPHVFEERNMQKAHTLVEQYGPISIVISRFIPAVNLPPFLAGLTSMDYHRYILFNLFGAVVWCSVIVIMGYFIGGLEIIRGNLNLLFDVVILALIITIMYAVAVLIKGLWWKNENVAI